MTFIQLKLMLKLQLIKLKFIVNIIITIFLYVIGIIVKNKKLILYI
jgi:hypothetical protein